MTITVSIEELTAYRNAMDQWTRKRAAHIANWAMQNASHEFGFARDPSREKCDAMIEKYDKENPMPKILPLL